MNSKTRVPLIIAFTMVLVFVVSLTATGAYLLLSGIQKVEKVVAENTQKGDIISDMRVSARLRALSLSQMLLIDDPFDREDEYERFNVFGTDFIVARNKLKKTNLTEQEKVIFEKEILYANKIGLIQQEIVENVQDGNIAKGTRLQVKKSIPLQRITKNNG